MQLQYLFHWIFTMQPWANNCRLQGLQGCALLPRVQIQPHPDILSLLHLVAAILKQVSASLIPVWEHNGVFGLVLKLLKILTSHITSLQPPATKTLQFMPNTILPCEAKHSRKIHNKITVFLTIIWVYLRLVKPSPNTLTFT